MNGLTAEVLLYLLAGSTICGAIPFRQFPTNTNTGLYHQYSSKIAFVETTLDDGFWYAPFTVGASNNLSLLVDTGSADIGLNTGKYAPSTTATNLHSSGNDSYGTTESSGCGTAIFEESLHLDSVTAGSHFWNVNAKNQTVGSVITSIPAGNAIPHDGIVGFAGQIVSGFNTTPFFHTLCDEGAVEECRFGLALGTEGKGKLVLGGLPRELFDGELSVAPIIEEWFLNGDVAIGNKTVAEDAFIELDSGTANIIGPIAVVRQIFEAAGVTATLQNSSDCGETLVGTYPCNFPPNLGFGFPSMTDAAASRKSGNSSVSQSSSVFGVKGSAFAAKDDGNGTCVSVLAGQDISLPQAPGKLLWVVGQPFFQGHYLDFDVEHGTVGLADLKRLVKT